MDRRGKKNRASETLEILRAKGEEHKHVAVAYSGGKDSMVVLDLASRAFERVSVFMMVTLPGLDQDRAMIDYVKGQWGFEVSIFPHWNLAHFINESLFTTKQLEVPSFTHNDMYRAIMMQLGVSLIVSGAKRADSMWRRQQLATHGKKDWLAYPIIGWQKHDTLGYLANRGLVRQEVWDGGGISRASDLDMTRASLRWQRHRWPNDYRKLRKVFPLVDLYAEQEEMFPQVAAQFAKDRAALPPDPSLGIGGGS